MHSYELRGVIRTVENNREKAIAIVRDKSGNMYRSIDVTNEDDIVEAIRRKLNLKEEELKIPHHVDVERAKRSLTKEVRKVARKD